MLSGLCKAVKSLITGGLKRWLKREPTVVAVVVSEAPDADMAGLSEATVRVLKRAAQAKR